MASSLVVRLRFELLEDSLDSILSSDRLVVEEFELGHTPEPQALAELTPQERRGPLQRPRALALRLASPIVV